MLETCCCLFLPPGSGTFPGFFPSPAPRPFTAGAPGRECVDFPTRTFPLNALHFLHLLFLVFLDFRKPCTFCLRSLLSPDSKHVAPGDPGQVHTGTVVTARPQWLCYQAGAPVGTCHPGSGWPLQQTHPRSGATIRGGVLVAHPLRISH